MVSGSAVCIFRGSGAFGDVANKLARMSGGKWVSPRGLLKASDGKMCLVLHDDQTLAHDREKFEAEEAALRAGPVNVLLKVTLSIIQKCQRVAVKMSHCCLIQCVSVMP